MELEDYKRAKQLQEETLPAFERLKKAVSAGMLDKATIKEIGDSFANAMFYENDFAESLGNFCDWEKYCKAVKNNELVRRNNHIDDDKIVH